MEPKITKYLSFKTYKNEENALKETQQFQVEKSKELGLTRNMYRKLPDDIYWNDIPDNFPKTFNTYEVHIKHGDCDKFMLIDECDLNTLDNFNICVTKNGHEHGHHYACVTQKCTREEKKNR